jgi:hypothetical protein
MGFEYFSTQKVRLSLKNFKRLAFVVYFQYVSVRLIQNLERYLEKIQA